MPVPLQQLFEDALPERMVAKCLAQIDADPRLYTTSIAVELEVWVKQIRREAEERGSPGHAAQEQPNKETDASTTDGTDEHG